MLVDTVHSSKLRELNNIVHLMWQRRGGGVRSGERGRECGKEAAARAALKGGEGELEAAARLWRALKAVAQLWRAARRRQRGYGGRGVGGINFPQCRPYFISILGIVIFL